MNDSQSNAEKKEELIPAVERHEEELRQALGDLQEAVQRKFTISDRICEEPLYWLGGAFAVGLLFGLMRSPEPSQRS